MQLGEEITGNCSSERWCGHLWSNIKGGFVEHKAAVAQEGEAEGLLDDCEQRGACWRESAAGCGLKCISQMIERKLH